MRDSVFGVKNNVSIIDVRKTYSAVIRALNVCYRYGKMNKKILFVGTAPQVAPIVKESAEKCGQFYVVDRWLGGILTNWYTVSKSIKTLLSYNKLLENTDSGLSKKEILTVTKKRDKLMASFGGLMNLRGRPDLVIVFHTKVDYLAIKEATVIGIPTIALLDTDANVDGVVYPIVSNDDNVNVVKFFCNEFVKAIVRGTQDGMKETGFDMSKLMEKRDGDNDKNDSSDKTENNTNTDSGADNDKKVTSKEAKTEKSDKNGSDNKKEKDKNSKKEVKKKKEEEEDVTKKSKSSEDKNSV